MMTILSLGRRAATLPAWLAALALFTMMVMTFADVVLRSVFNTPIEAATEMTRILMAVVVFSVLPVVSGRGEQISVDLLDPVLPRGLHRWRDACLSLLCGVLLWFPAERVLVLAERAAEYGDRTEYLGLPQVWVAGFVAALTFLTCAVLVLRGAVIAFLPDTGDAS